MFTLRRVGLAVGGIAAADLAYYGYLRSSEKRHPFNGYMTAEEAMNGLNLNGKTAIVTGCNTGIGKETARVLTKQGCNVIMACRSQKKADKARSDILEDLKLSSDYDKLSVMSLDLNSLDSVKSFADDFNGKNIHIDYLINNAGVSRLMSGYSKTKDGFEGMFGVNHLAHFYLTNLLTPSLFRQTTEDTQDTQGQTRQRPRVINVSSLGESMTDRDYAYWSKMVDAGLKELKFWPDDYVNDFTGPDGYAFSKSCNILFSKELIKKYGDDKIVSVSLQPGAISGTDLVRDFNKSEIISIIKYSWKGGLFSQKFMVDEVKTIQQGAANTIRCVSATEDEISNGSFYHNCRAKDSKVRGIASEKQDKNGVMAEKVWELSKALLEAKGHSIDNV